MKQHWSITLIFVLLLIGCDEKSNKEAEGGHPKKIDQYLRAHVANGKFNGSIKVKKANTTLFHKHFGYANRELETPINDSTKFLIGSITKPFVAMCILILETNGKLSLSDKLADYFPDFPKAEQVTIRQLLNHSAGIRDYHYFKDWKELSQTKIEPLDVIEQVKTDPYLFEPGKSFRYSNTGYILLGLIIEKVTEKSFEDALSTLITEPLELRNTGVISNQNRPDNIALGYRTSPRETLSASYINYNQPFTSGNMYSTVDDVQSFLKAVVSSDLISQEKTDLIFQKGKGNYGLGWGLRDFNGIQGYGHHGGMNGYWGSVTYLPESDISICFLTNDDNTPKYTITKDLVSILTEGAYNLPKSNVFSEINTEKAKDLCGDYLIKKGDTLHVFTQKNKLYLQETGQLSYELFDVGSSRFAMTMQEFNVLFKGDTLKFEGIVNLKAIKLKTN